ncbi:hypothetical protein PG993_013832 [Apiospora rasikravindrae]|uniref:UBC core domain-containing protein n=1 Tax=Apiospora rasikravindrae TaxID=990691 RepID=A0ABR1RRA5_9PEZI
MSPEYPKKAPFKKFSLSEDDWGVQLRPIRLLDVQANTQEYAHMLARLEVNWKRARTEARLLENKSMSMRILNAETANPTATAIVTFEGPPQSPYRTGIFQLRVLYGPNYPRMPMEVNFLTKIYHPNVDHTGKVCLDLLGKYWVPAWSTEKVVLCIMALLSDPCPEDALVPEIVSTYLQDRELYGQNAAMYTEKYATLDAALGRMSMACE